MRRLIKKKGILCLLVLIGTFAISFSVFALELNWPASPGGIDLNDEQSQTITFLIAYIYEWAMVIGGLATFIALVSAGFQYLTSAGDAGKMGEAKKQITSAITGLALLLSTFLILNTINPELTTLDIPEITLSTSIFEPLDPDDVKLDQGCDLVRVYPKHYDSEGDEDDPPVVIISRGSEATVDIAKKQGSIMFVYINEKGNEVKGGFCAVGLYDNEECAGDVDGTKSYSDDYLQETYEIKCVKVEEYHF